VSHGVLTSAQGKLYQYNDRPFSNRHDRDTVIKVTLSQT